MPINDIMPEKEPIVDDELRRRAEAMVRLMGGDYGMSVGVGEQGSGWHWDFVKNHVNMDPLDLINESLDVVRGVASHEGNHRLASRPEYVQDMWREPGFAFGFNAVEDPRVNEAGMKIKPGTRPWIKAYIEKDLSEGGGLDYQHIRGNAEDKLGYVPKHMQWGAEMIRYWHSIELADEVSTTSQRQDFLNQIPDKEVRETVESSIDKFKEFYQAVPESRDEMEVRRKAKHSSEIFKKDIWPQYELLVEQSLNDQAIVNMLVDMLQEDQKHDEQNSTGAPSMADLPQDLQDEIRKKVQEHMQKRQKQSSQNEKSNDSQQNNGNEGEQGGESSSSTASGSNSSTSSTEQSQGSQGVDDEGSSSIQVPWDQLSDDAKQAAKQAYDELNEKLKNDYTQKAQDDLEVVEDEANENLRGKMNDPRYTETHQEQKDRSEAQQEAAKQRQASEAISELLSQNREELLDRLPDNPYHTFRNLEDVSRSIRLLDGEFKKIFTPNEQPGVRFSYTGQGVNMRRAMEFAADKRRGAIFETKGRPTEKSHRFLWEVDLSGSMEDKIAEAFKVIVVNTELASRHGLETAVVGFTSSFPGSTMVYKEFDTKRLTRDARDKLGGIIPDCMNGGGTPLLDATNKCYEMIKERNLKTPMAHNYFITLTDGSPTDSSPVQLAEAVREKMKDRTIIVAGFGIGPGTHYVNSVYPQLHDNIKQEIARVLKKPMHEISNSFSNATEFTTASVIILRNMVEHPELFYR